MHYPYPPPRPAPPSGGGKSLYIAIVCIFFGIPLLGIGSCVACSVIGAAARATSDAPVAKNAPTPREPAPSPEATDTVTLSDYQRISDGMSYSDVVGVIKVSGTEVSRSGSGGDIQMVMYIWRNERGRGSMTVMFKNDRLMSKSQFGLK